jgi:hypothetical protein
MCNACDLQKRAAEKEKAYLEKAKQAYERRKEKMEKGSLREKLLTQRKFEDKATKKIGYFRAAAVLYAQGRYHTAHDKISKAMKVIRKEHEQEEKERELQAKWWRHVLRFNDHKLIKAMEDIREGEIKRKKAKRRVRSTSPRKLRISGA